MLRPGLLLSRSAAAAAHLAAKHNDLVTDLLCPVLIGRDAETARLRSALAAAQDGAGGVMFLTGEAGIGKSRLASELAAEARARGATVLAGRAVPASASIPYRPLTEALLQALRERAFPGDPGLTPWLPALRAVIPTIGGTEGDGRGDHAAPVRGEAVLQLLRRFAGSAGLLLVLEDLHWADPDTLAVVEYLSDNLSAEAVLCVATCRGETPSAGAELVARVIARRAARHLALGRLTAGQVAAMVRACLPPAPDKVIARVQRAADGIPFLVEESLAAPGVPRSFADGVRSRLAALSDDGRLVLHTAALLGRQFDWRLLPAATGLDAGLVAGALEHGVGAQLLAVDGRCLPVPAHADQGGCGRRATPAAAGQPSPPARSRPWRRLTRAARGNGDLAANLALQAGDQDRAGGLLLASGRSALDRGALATSIDTLRRAVDLLSDREQRDEAEMLPCRGPGASWPGRRGDAVGDRLIIQMRPGAGSATARAAVHLKLAHAAVDATRWAAARRQLALAGDLLAAVPQAGGRRRDGHLERRGRIRRQRHRPGSRPRRQRPGLAAGKSPDPLPRARTTRPHPARNDLDAARDAFEQALATADAAGLAVWRLRALHQLGTIDMFDDARTDRLSQARRIADELGAASTGAVIDLQLTALAMFRFELGEAEHHAQSAVATGTRLGLAKTHAIGLLFLAEIQALRRRPRGHGPVSRARSCRRTRRPGNRRQRASGRARDAGAARRRQGGRSGGPRPRRRHPRHAAPARPGPYRAMWPLLLAANGDPRRGGRDRQRPADRPDYQPGQPGNPRLR